MPLDGPALRRALGPEAGAGLETVHSTLCRREAGAFQRAAKGGEPLLVACTQESRLFLELNEQTEGAPGIVERPIRFVNIRETGRLVEGCRGSAAEDGGADRGGAAAAGRAGAAGQLPLERSGARHRPRRDRPARRPHARRQARRHRAAAAARRRRAAGARDGGPCRQPDQPARLARRLRGELDQRQSDRPRPVHALQRLHRGLPRAGDRLQLPDRPREVHRAPALRARLRGRRRDRLRAPGAGRDRVVRPRARSRRDAADRAAPAAPGLLPCRATTPLW